MYVLSGFGYVVSFGEVIGEDLVFMEIIVSRFMAATSRSRR